MRKWTESVLNVLAIAKELLAFDSFWEIETQFNLGI